MGQAFEGAENRSGSLAGAAGKCGAQGVGGQLGDDRGWEVEGVDDGPIVVTEVASEVGGVVGVEGDDQAGVDHGGQRMVSDGRYASEPDVGQRAYGERNPIGDQAADESVVFHGPDAVVYALGAQDVESLPDVVRRAFLAGVGDPVEAQLGGGGEHLAEESGWVSDLGGVQANGEERIGMGDEGFEGLPGLWGPRSRRKHTMRPADTPCLAVASAMAADRPETTSSSGTPRLVWAWGSKRISARTTWSSTAFCRYAVGQVVEVLCFAQHGHALVIQGKE